MQPEKKMKRLENRELFQDFNRTIASVLFEENTYPWEVLPKIHDFIMEVGMLLSKDEYEEVKEHVWVAKSAMVAPTAYINGPAIIGPDAEIRHCAFIRGNAIVGEGAVVGNSTELKNVILFDKRKLISHWGNRISINRAVKLISPWMTTSRPSCSRTRHRGRFCKLKWKL